METKRKDREEEYEEEYEEEEEKDDMQRKKVKQEIYNVDTNFRNDKCCDEPCECPICFDIKPLKELLPCQHYFCQECIERNVIRGVKTSQCPSCNQMITSIGCKGINVSLEEFRRNARRNPINTNVPAPRLPAPMPGGPSYGQYGINGITQAQVNSNQALFQSIDYFCDKMVRLLNKIIKKEYENETGQNSSGLHILRQTTANDAKNKVYGIVLDYIEDNEDDSEDKFEEVVNDILSDLKVFAEKELRRHLRHSNFILDYYDDPDSNEHVDGYTKISDELDLLMRTIQAILMNNNGGFKRKSRRSKSRRRKTKRRKTKRRKSRRSRRRKTKTRKNQRRRRKY